MKRTFVVCTLAAMLSVVSAFAAGGRPAQGPPPSDRSDTDAHLAAPDHIAPETRAELAMRMAQHGQAMSSLVRAVILLDRPSIGKLGTRIAEDAAAAANDARGRRLGLPPGFYSEQSELSKVARRLVAAALEGGNDQALADNFSALTATCIRCHSVYLHGRPAPAPIGPDAPK